MWILPRFAGEELTVAELGKATWPLLKGGQNVPILFLHGKRRLSRTSNTEATITALERRYSILRRNEPEISLIYQVPGFLPRNSQLGRRSYAAGRFSRPGGGENSSDEIPCYFAKNSLLAGNLFFRRSADR